MIFYKLTINRIILLIYLIAIVYFITAIMTNDPIKLWLSIIIGTGTYSYLIVALWRRNKLTPVKGNCSIAVDDEKVEFILENGKRQAIQWSDVNRITVRRIESKDPQVANEVWLRLHSYPWRKVVTVPWRANNFQSLYERVSNWENFDINKLDRAKRASKPINVTVWERVDF